MSLSADELGIILLSLKVAVVSVAFSLPVAIGVAYVLARFEFPGKTLLDAVVHLPLVLPPVVVGFALLVLFGRHGPIGAWLESWFGIVFAFRWTGAALAAAIMGFPLMVGDLRLEVAFQADAPIVGLFGRSGAGKTSLVNTLAGIARPLRGRIVVNSETLFDSERGVDLPPERRRLGYVFQDDLLFPHLNVAANLLYGYRRAPASARIIDPEHIIELLGLRSLLHRLPDALSGGEKQRIAIGRALLAQPRLLLMDEPLASLDVARRDEVLRYIELLRDDLAIPIVYVSHSVAEITRLADTVVILSDGKAIAVGDVDEVMGRLDLRPQTGRYEAGAVIDTVVAGHDTEYGLTQ